MASNQIDICLQLWDLARRTTDPLLSEKIRQLVREAQAGVSIEEKTDGELMLEPGFELFHSKAVERGVDDPAAEALSLYKAFRRHAR